MCSVPSNDRELPGELQKIKEWFRDYKVYPPRFTVSHHTRNPVAASRSRRM